MFQLQREPPCWPINAGAVALLYDRLCNSSASSSRYSQSRAWLASLRLLWYPHSTSTAGQLANRSTPKFAQRIPPFAKLGMVGSFSAGSHWPDQPNAPERTAMSGILRVFRLRESLKWMLTKTAFFCLFSIATLLLSGMNTSESEVMTVFNCDSRSLRSRRWATSSATALLRWTVATICTAVLPTVARVHDHSCKCFARVFDTASPNRAARC